LLRELRRLVLLDRHHLFLGRRRARRGLLMAVSRPSWRVLIPRVAKDVRAMTRVGILREVVPQTCRDVEVGVAPTDPPWK
jgi:hypothetical protein